MKYRVSRILPFAPRLVWRALEDVEHFARDDPFHHEFGYLTTRTSGLGTRFRLKHTYFPIFPFAADDVECTITEWAPERAQTLIEKNRRSYRTHVQRFTLRPEGLATLVEYTIAYMGIPSWIFPLAQWVQWKVKGRMEKKLSELAHQCAQELNCQDYESALPAA